MIEMSSIIASTEAMRDNLTQIAIDREVRLAAISRVYAARLSEGLNIKPDVARARVDVLLDRMRRDPELLDAFEEMSLRLGGSLVTGVGRKDDGTIEVSVIPVVPGWKHMQEKTTAMFMRNAQDNLRRGVADFELSRVFPRGRVSALPMLRSLGLR